MSGESTAALFSVEPILSSTCRVPGTRIFVAGDSAGIAQGIIQAAMMGVQAAAHAIAVDASQRQQTAVPDDRLGHAPEMEWMRMASNWQTKAFKHDRFDAVTVGGSVVYGEALDTAAKALAELGSVALLAS